MFHAVPSGGDAYVLRLIIHDWIDAEAITILRHCRAAMNDHGKLLLIESVLKPVNEPGSG